MLRKARAVGPDQQSASTSFVSRWHRWLPVVVFAVSILFTLIFLAVLPSSFRVNEPTDYNAFYEPVARNILAGQGVSLTQESPATKYPPGYPLVLAGVLGVSHRLHIPEEVGLSFLAVVGMGLTSVLIFLLARLIWGTTAALVSGLLWMTYPFALWLTKQPNSEIPFTVVFYAALLVFWYALSGKAPARALYFVCGLLCGFAMLLRPIAIGIGVLLAGNIWFFRRDAITARLSLIVLLLAGNFLAVLPWEGLVYKETGRLIPLSTNGVQSMQNGVTFAVEDKGYRQRTRVPADVIQVMNDVHSRESEVVTSKAFALVMLQEFRSHPVAVAKLFGLKMARSWYGTDSGRREWPILVIQMLYLVLIGWSIRVVWKQGGIHHVFATSALLTTLYFWLMTFLALSILRYMVPVTGLLFVLAGGAMASRWSSTRRPSLKTVS